MEVYHSRYQHIAFYPEHELIETTWLPSSYDMTREEYMQELLNYSDIILKLLPKKVLGDARSMFFPIDPALQEWTDQKITVASLEIGLTKAAVVISQEMITQLSIEQTMEEREGLKYTARYFESKVEAKAWLIAL